jgi:nucleoside-diphosphate-sugar epimerase
MRILVTGSGGFVGSRLVTYLHTEGIETLTLDLKTGLDLRAWDQVKDIGPFKVMIHLASLIGRPKVRLDPRTLLQSNLTCTLHALELCRLQRAKMIYVSSYVYGQPEYLPTDESHPLSAFNPYAESKIIGERLCDFYQDRFKMPVIALRPFNLYGPGQHENFLIPTIVKQLTADEVVVNDLAPKRDFLHVDDFIALLSLLIDYNPSGTRVFNAGSGTSASVKEIIDMFSRLVGRPLKVSPRNRKLRDEILETRADIEKAACVLGWEPKISLRHGLADLLKDVR